ncbi:hypothetical protein J2X19_000726 [Rhodoferax ferrireducens]|uniref:DUF4304 domain-containing protein n=1 Tax=Rhodoferax ferrireducens TaxID=192843 RepID=A0ABU2C412_9BURK|nr:DUF4304 domain-containing protein [Rhodoferax ferrireducens]MDR7376068.1 hypothetical protein [Rhodoferax ferrireducens]
MTVHALGKALASDLHRVALKGRGFKKSGNTFSREHEDYVEMLQIRGSDWNSGAEPWMFYVNVSVRFTNLTNSFASQGSKYDADGRIDRIVLEAPGRFELTRQNLNEVTSMLASLSEKASHLLPGLLVPVRERASHGLYSPIPVPATWLAGQA